MYWQRERVYLRGLPLLIICLALQPIILCWAASDGGLNSTSPAQAPSRVMESTNNNTQSNSPTSINQENLIRQQQNLTLVFVVGVCISFAIFGLTYCVAYRTIMARQGELALRRRRSQVRGIESEDARSSDYGSSEERVAAHGGLDHHPSLVSSLRTVHYSSKMLKEKEMMGAPAEGDHHPVQDQVVVMWVKECAVCLCEFEEGEEMKVLPVCGHCFHGTCIEMWLFSNTTCPICRLSLLKLPPADPAIAVPPSPNSPRSLHVAVDVES